MAGNRLGAMLRKQGRLTEAEALFRETLEAGRELPPPASLSAVLAGYADVLRDQGRLAEAEPMYREGLDLCRRLTPNDFERRQWLAAGLALALKGQGRWAETEPFYREPYQRRQGLAKQFHEMGMAVQRSGGCAPAPGKTDEVEQLRHEILPATVPSRPTETTSTNIISKPKLRLDAVPKSNSRDR